MNNWLKAADKDLNKLIDSIRKALSEPIINEHFW